MPNLPSKIRSLCLKLLLLGAPFILIALLYGYNTSSLEYRSGIVIEAKTGGKSIGRSGVVRYCNFKISGDTTTYGYYFGMPSIFASMMGIKHKVRITEGDKVGFWFKPDEKNKNELYLKDDLEDINYRRYSLKKLSADEAYVINIRGLSANGEMILKPQLYNYVKKGMYYPVLLTGFLAIIMLVAFAILISANLKKKIVNLGDDNRNVT